MFVFWCFVVVCSIFLIVSFFGCFFCDCCFCVEIHTCCRQWPDIARCTCIHSCPKSLSLDQMLYPSLTSDTDADSVNGSRKRFAAYDTVILFHHFVCSFFRRGGRSGRDFFGKCVARDSFFDHRQCQEP